MIFFPRRECPIKSTADQMKEAANALTATAEKMIHELQINGHKIKEAARDKTTAH